MRATFYGFESVRKGLLASQVALDVTSQNVSNVNTEGYTRQTVDLTSMNLTGTSRYARTLGDVGVGQGVNVSGINQSRDQFLDARYRKENAQYGMWNTGLSIMTDVENVLDEVSTDGLNARLTDVYKQLQSFSLNAESIEYASNFRSSAQKLVEVFNQYSKRLDDIYNEHVYNAGTEVTTVNQIIDKIAELNTQIKHGYVQGVQPNELLDARNLQLDKLAGLIGSGYEYSEDGQVSVKLGDTYLLDAKNDNAKETLSLDSSGYPVSVTLSDGSTADVTGGSLAGYLSGLNGKGVFAEAGEDSSRGIQYFRQSIDELARIFADTFNDLNDDTGAKNLFVYNDSSGEINAGNISISDEWLKDAMYITRSISSSGEGSNDNLLRMLGSMEEKKDITPYFKGTFEEYMASVMGDMSIEVEFKKDMKNTSESVLTTVSNQRESVMGVSIDEEGINMVKYQNAYNAAARLMTAMDEMLEKMINEMGLVGR